MLLLASVLLAGLLLLNGAAAVVQRNKLRKSRRRQARSLLLSLSACESYGQRLCQQESAGDGHGQKGHVPGIGLMNIGSEV